MVTRTTQICIFNNGKKVVLHALHVQFSFLDILLPVFQSRGRREQTITKFQFGFLSPNCWNEFNSRVVRIHFAGIVTRNHWKIIAETESHIFRWSSRCRQRRPFLSYLMLSKEPFLTKNHHIIEPSASWKCYRHHSALLSEWFMSTCIYAFTLWNNTLTPIK